MQRITADELKRLIEDYPDEAIHVEFKQEWDKNNATLIHDILCLGNADNDGDRFLLMGVNNKAKIVGLDGDQHRKNNASPFDFLRSNHVNRLPDIDIYTL